jgi:hypothetical protein
MTNRYRIYPIEPGVFRVKKKNFFGVWCWETTYVDCGWGLVRCINSFKSALLAEVYIKSQLNAKGMSRHKKEFLKNNPPYDYP